MIIDVWIDVRVIVVGHFVLSRDEDVLGHSSSQLFKKGLLKVPLVWIWPSHWETAKKDKSRSQGKESVSKI